MTTEYKGFPGRFFSASLFTSNLIITWISKQEKGALKSLEAKNEIDPPKKILYGFFFQANKLWLFQIFKKKCLRDLGIAPNDDSISILQRER